jgi:hypothetical protein
VCWCVNDDLLSLCFSCMMVFSSVLLFFTHVARRNCSRRSQSRWSLSFFRCLHRMTNTKWQLQWVWLSAISPLNLARRSQRKRNRSQWRRAKLIKGGLKTHPQKNRDACCFVNAHSKNSLSAIVNNLLFHRSSWHWTRVEPALSSSRATIPSGRKIGLKSDLTHGSLKHGFLRENALCRRMQDPRPFTNTCAITSSSIEVRVWAPSAKRTWPMQQTLPWSL